MAGFFLGLNNLHWKSATSSSEKKLLKEYANQILSKCSQATYHSSCYDKEIPLLMDNPTNLSMEEAFKVSELVQEKDSSYQYCHVLGHNLSSKETGKDPSKWKEVLTRCPNGVCANGCLHGSLMERFKSESLTDPELEQLKPELVGVCEKRANWQPTKSQQGVCFHGLGHLLMYASAADINKSIEICNFLTSQSQTKSYSRQCVDGAFMQIYQPLEAEDFALIKGKEVKKDQLARFCNQFSLQVKTECYLESWPLSADEILNPSGLIRFCSFTKDPVEKERCYFKTIGIITTKLSTQDKDMVNKINKLCTLLSENGEAKQCFKSAATRLVRNDIKNGQKAVEICLKADKEIRDYCFSDLSSYAKIVSHPNSAEFNNYCQSLPDPWNKKCLEGN